MIERNKTNVALDGLFEQFLNLISEARRVPLVDKIMVDENDLLNIIDDLKEAIPREIKSANQVLEEQKNIVNKAYADADRIVQQAKDEAERIVSVAQAEADAKVQQEEIVKQAKKEASAPKKMKNMPEEVKAQLSEKMRADLQKELNRTGIPVEQGFTKKEIGRACGIKVKAASAALLTSR